MTLFETILAQEDPWEYIYEAINGTHGVEARDVLTEIFQSEHVLTEMYNQVCIDYHLHPDDDFEKIFDRMIEQIEEDV
jgi:hypothetical protein